MNRELKHTFKWIFALSILCGTLHATEVLVDTQDGEKYVLDVDLDQSLQELQNKIAALNPASRGNLCFEVISEGAVKCSKGQLNTSGQGSYLGFPRNYYEEVTAHEKSDIHFIITSLANKSLISIALIKAELEDAGDRIDHIHPLRFLMTVFTDEELKVGIRNIRGSGWIWNSFTGGLKSCLATESSIGNMQNEYIIHFAQTLGIDVNLIYHSIQNYDWDELIDLLILHIPRQGEHGRYDC